MEYTICPLCWRMVVVNRSGLLVWHTTEDERYTPDAPRCEGSLKSERAARARKDYREWVRGRG